MLMVVLLLWLPMALQRMSWLSFARLSSYLILYRPADQSRSPPPLCWPLAASTPAENSYSWHLPDGNDLQGQAGVANGR
jgi:hypothetical protein